MIWQRDASLHRVVFPVVESLMLALPIPFFGFTLLLWFEEDEPSSGAVGGL